MNSNSKLRWSLAAVLGLLLSIISFAPAQAAPTFTDTQVRACVDAGNVWVVVDFGDGRVEGGCATDFSTGGAALVSAGFVPDNTGFVTVINGVRADYVKDGKWWTYWHKQFDPAATTCAAWEFSNAGAGQYQPAPGSIEGWSVSPAAGASRAPEWDCVAPGTPAAEVAPTIVKQPADVSVSGGSTATFTVEGRGAPKPTWAWESSPDGATWTAIPGATGTTLTMESVTADQTGLKIRARATNSVGTAVSEAATLTVSVDYADIPDTKFRACLNDKLRQPQTAQITVTQLAGLTGDLACSSSTAAYKLIADIKGAEHLTNITGLSLGGHQVSDLSPLAGLTNLTSITMYGNGITDIGPLAGLTKLTNVSMATNKIADLKPLANLKDLTNLMLNGNQVADASQLSTLPKLVTVGLSNNQLTSVSNIASTSIADITFDANKIERMDVSGMPSLKRIVAHNNGFSDISSLSNLASLETFASIGNKIEDLSPVSGLPKLKSLIVSNNRIANVAPLSSFSTLTTLDLSTNRIADASPLKDLRVTDSSGRRIRYQAVTGEQVHAGAAVPQPKFTNPDGTAATVTLPAGVTDNGDGTYTYAEPGTYKITWTSAQLFSGTFTQEVVPEPETPEASVSATSAGTKPAGQATNVWGTVVGGADSRVWTEVQVNGKWSTSQIGKTDGDGRFVLPLTYGAHAAGDYTYRVGAQTGATVTYSEPFTLTWTASVAAASAGTKAAGQATNVWGIAAGGANARVWTEVQVNGKWSTSQIGKTDGDGRFVLPLTYGSHAAGDYTYRVGAQTGAAVTYSEPFTLTWTASVAAASAGTKQVGQATNVWGVAAGGANARVWTEVQVNGKWSTSQIGRTDAAGRYVLPLTYGVTTAGTYTYRVGVQTGATVTYSAPFTLTRT